MTGNSLAGAVHRGRVGLYPTIRLSGFAEIDNLGRKLGGSMPAFYWTQYSFNRPDKPLTFDAWAALRSNRSADHEKIIERMSEERWSQFWKSNAFLTWACGGFVVGLACYLMGGDNSGLKAFGAIAVFFTFVAPLTLFITSLSHASAISKQCNYFRTEFGRAATAETYESYLQKYNLNQS